MMLVWIILILLISGAVAWLLSQWNKLLSKVICLLGLIIQLGLIIALWIQSDSISSDQKWIGMYSHSWIPSFGIHIKLAVDGLGLIMILLNTFLGIGALVISWREVNKKVGFFLFNLMLLLAGITGVFLAMDLFLFYFSWELMLIPMFFLISIWGNEKRKYAAIKFFLFTQEGGMLMFLSIMGLYFHHGQHTGVYTFDYQELLGTVLEPNIGIWLMLGFVMAFIVKMATVPFHSWLLDAYTQAPISGSIILAGSLLNAGAYGLIRFVLPLFPQAAHQFAPVAMTLGVVSILYGAKLAFAQTDIKRLIGYISISHVGFILIGIFAFTEIALQGVVMEIVAHAICICGLFILAHSLQNRLHTRDLEKMGGLWEVAPKMGVMGLIFVMASLGLPGLGNFVGEILILLGTFSENKVFAIIAASGLIFSVVYSLRLMQKIFYGKKFRDSKIIDLTRREQVIMIPMAVIIIGLGIYPMAILNISKNSVEKIIQNVSSENELKSIGNSKQRPRSQHFSTSTAEEETSWEEVVLKSD